MGKLTEHTQLTPTLGLSICSDGVWLWDETQGMNLAMHAKTERSAFVEALTYYQRRLIEVEAEHKALKEKVDAFVSQVKEPCECEECR